MGGRQSFQACSVLERKSTTNRQAFLKSHTDFIIVNPSKSSRTDRITGWKDVMIMLVSMETYIQGDGFLRAQFRRRKLNYVIVRF